MKIFLFLQSIEDSFISEMVNALQEDIDSLEYIDRINPNQDISAGFVVMLRVYPREDFKYPARSQQITTLSKKEKRLLVSTNIEIEELIGKSGIEIYNIFLDRIIATLFIFEKKRIAGVNVGELKASIGSLKC